MNPFNELRAGLCALAKRSVGVMGVCANEESTKLYLALPLVGLLGYDYSNPYEVYPEHAADAADAAGGKSSKIGLAIMRGGNAVVGLECKRVGADLVEPRGELRAYFDAVPTVKLGILTNGIVFEFFVDSATPEVMDDEPFLVLDLETVARNGVPDELLETLIHLTKQNFNPETIAEMAHIHLCKKRLRSLLIAEANSPTEEFCRFVLQRAGLKNVRKGTIERHYGPLIKNAFEEALVLPIVQKLRSEAGPEGKFNAVNLHQIGQRIVTTERELALIAYVRRRLAFLVAEEALYNAIDQIDYRDYLGKLSVFYSNERSGRLFDFVEAGDGINKFIFPAPFCEIVTNNMLDIDEALKATFTARVRELGSLPLIGRLAQIA
jgi:hypothetical protein